MCIVVVYIMTIYGRNVVFYPRNIRLSLVSVNIFKYMNLFQHK